MKTIAAAFAVAAMPAIGTRASPAPGASAVSSAPSAPRRNRIYMLLPAAEGPTERAFRAQLALQGIDAEFVPRDTAGDVNRIPTIIREARARGADLIYVSGAPLAEAVAGPPGPPDPARSVTDIPVVFTALTLTRQEGAHLAEHRHNVTGIAAAIPLSAQLDAIRAYRAFERIAVIANPANRAAMAMLDELRAAAAGHQVTLLERHVPLDGRGQPLSAALPELVAALARQEAQLLYVPHDDWLAANRKAITESALAQKLPCFAADAILLRDARALFGVAPNPEGAGRMAGFKAARILKDGVQPAALPVEALPRHRLIINMPVATKLDLYPPVALLNTAEILR